MVRVLRMVAADPASLTISLIFAVHSLLSGNWLVRLPEIQARLSLSEAELGLALLGMPAGAVLMMPLMGWIAARWGAGRVTFITTLALCAFTLLPPFAESMAALAAAFFFIGVAGGAMDIAMNAEAAAIEATRRKAILSACHGFYSIGGMVGAAMGGLIAAAHVPLSLHMAGVVLALIVMTMLRRDTLLHGAAASAPATKPVLALPTRPLLGLSLIGFCVFIGEGAMADWSAIYLRNTLGTGAAVAGLGYALFSMAMAVGRLYGDVITARFAPARVVRAGCLLAAVGLGSALLIAHPIAALLGFLCVGFGYAAIVPIVYRAGAQTPGMAPGAGIASVAAAGYAGLFIGPPLIGFTADAIGLPGALGLVAALALVAYGLAPGAFWGRTTLPAVEPGLSTALPSEIR